MKYRIIELDYNCDEFETIVHENFNAKNDKEAIARFEKFKACYAEENAAYFIDIKADLELRRIIQVEKTKQIAT